MKSHDIARLIAEMSRHKIHAADACEDFINHLERFEQALSNMSSKKASHQLIRLSEPSLQLRRDMLDSIKVLIKTNRYMCHALGIDPGHTFEQNCERLIYQLGNELYQEKLHDLFELSRELQHHGKLNKSENIKKQKQQSLLKSILEDENIEHTTENSTSEVIDKRNKVAKTLSQVHDHFQPILHELHQALECLVQFQFSLEQLTESLHAYPGLPAFGVFYDYVATLKGPVDRFHQALKHGMDVMSELSIRLAKINMPQQTLPSKNQTEHEELKRLASLARTLQLRMH